jgi:hypothetical protein
VVALASGAGCLSTTTAGDNAAGLIHTHYEYHDSWSPEYGCYDDVAGYVYNTGNISTQNLKLDFNLVNTGTGTIRDSRSVYIGSLGPGQTQNYETILDGECSQDYRVDFAFENP